MTRLAARAAVMVLLFSGCVARDGAHEDRDEIRFEHGPHLRIGARCTDCHGGANPQREGSGLTAGKGRLGLLPAEDLCKMCHREPAERQCRFCHTKPDQARTYEWSNRDLVFAHPPHQERVTGGCITCHGVGLASGSLAGFQPSFPPMATCTDSCHADDMRDFECQRCHTNLHRYRLEDISVASHGPGWVHRHGPSARAEGAYCLQCHEPTYCARCHTASPGMPLEQLEPMGVLRDFVHRGDWLPRHPTEARLEQAMCLRCHGPGYCDGCHRETGVGGSVRPGSPHPPGWLDPVSPEGHAREARRDILTCAACHEADARDVCVPCHRVGGVASSPHPPSFGGGLDPMAHGICRVCHAATP